MSVNRAKKVGGKKLNNQAREIIFNVHKFMKKEAELGPLLLLQVQHRVAEATGVSRSTVQRILREGKDAQWSQTILDENEGNGEVSLKNRMTEFVQIDEDTEFEEDEVLIPSRTHVDNDETDPLAINMATVDEFCEDEELHSLPVIKPNEDKDVPMSTVSDDFQIKVEEEIHIEDYDDREDFNERSSIVAENVNECSSTVVEDINERSSTVVEDFNEHSSNVADGCRNKYEGKFDLEEGEINQQETVFVSVDNIKEEQPSCSTDSGMTPGPEEFTEDIATSSETIKWEVSYNCKICTFHCRFEESVKKHLSTHKYDYQDSAMGHVYQEHNLSRQMQKTFNCKYCQYKTVRFSDIKRHMLTCNKGDKIVNCKFCKYKSLRSGVVKRHMLIHENEKKFTCNICQYSCAKSCHLKTHMLTHTGEKKDIVVLYVSSNALGLIV